MEANVRADQTGTTQIEQALELVPTIEAIGLNDVFEMLDVTHLAFDAELFPDSLDIDNGASGDAVNLSSTLRTEEETSVQARSRPSV